MKLFCSPNPSLQTKAPERLPFTGYYSTIFVRCKGNLSKPLPSFTVLVAFGGWLPHFLPYIDRVSGKTVTSSPRCA